MWQLDLLKRAYTLARYWYKCAIFKVVLISICVVGAVITGLVIVGLVHCRGRLIQRSGNCCFKSGNSCGTGADYYSSNSSANSYYSTIDTRCGHNIRLFSRKLNFYKRELISVIFGLLLLFFKLRNFGVSNVQNFEFVEFWRYSNSNIAFSPKKHDSGNFRN